MIARRIVALCAAFVLTAPLRPALASELKIPHPTHLRLPNGLEVLLVERHDLPIVSAMLVVHAGTVNDPKDKPGVADMTAALLTKGTTAHTAHQIASQLDAMGASLEAAAEPDRTDVHLNVLKRDLDAGLSLMGEVVAHPAFAPSEFVKVKQLEAAGVQSALDDPSRLLTMVTARGLYGMSAYGHPLSAGLKAMEAIARDDVARYYRDHYRVDRSSLVVVGDVTPAELAQHFVQPFRDWVTAPTQDSPSDPIVPTGWHGAQLVDMDLNQANISVSFPAIARTDPDYYPLLVTTHILGGGYLSRLYKHVREERGLAYSVYATNVLRRKAGASVIVLQTKQESLSEALQLVLDQVRDLREHPVSEHELAAVKTYFAGKLPRDLEANQDLGEEMAEISFYGLGDDYFDRLLPRIQAVTVQDVQRVARKYFDADHQIVNVVGKALVVRGAMAPYGPVHEVQRADLIR